MLWQSVEERIAGLEIYLSVSRILSTKGQKLEVGDVDFISLDSQTS
jgi:hypothetical protein